MVWTKEKTAGILRQLRDITEDVERLDHGVCDLEAKQLIIFGNSGAFSELRSEVNFLTAMNNSTADSIQKSLREVEDALREEDEVELVQQFLKVLKSSLRILQEYRMVQHTYVDEMNKRLSTVELYEDLKKVEESFSSSGKRRERNYSWGEGNWMAIILRRICSCSCMN